MAAGLEYLTNYQSQYPSLSGFVSNITWRQCALKRIKSCRQPNNMPYPKWFLHPPASIFQPRLNWQDLLCCLLTPFPQSTGRARAARSERRGVWGGAPSPVPTATWSMGKQSHFLCLVRWPQGPVGKHHCSLLPTLPCPLLCSPGYISHDTSSTSAWGGHSFTLGTSPGTQDPSRDLRAKLYSVLHLRGT